MAIDSGDESIHPAQPEDPYHITEKKSYWVGEKAFATREGARDFVLGCRIEKMVSGKKYSASDQKIVKSFIMDNREELIRVLFTK